MGKPKIARISVVILAATAGNGMEVDGPKCLINLGSESILERQLRLIKESFYKPDIVVVAGYLPQLVKHHIKKMGVKVVVNWLYKQSNVTTGFKLGLKHTRHNIVLFIYGDLVFNEKLLKSILLGESCSIVDKRGQISQYDVGCTVVDEYATQFSYGLKRKWCPIFALRNKELELFKAAVAETQRSRYYGFELLNLVLNNGGKIRAIIPTNLKIVDVDSPKDILKARRLCQT